jgi:periplasmic protein TonB
MRGLVLLDLDLHAEEPPRPVRPPEPPPPRPAPPPRAARPERLPETLFTDLVVSNPPALSRRARATLRVSAAAHVVAITAIVLVPILAPPPPPERIDYIRALIYDPPPPPPPPLPKGSALVQRAEPEPPKPVTEEVQPEKPKFEAPQLNPTDVRPEAGVRASDQFGSPTGSDLGVPEGMEGGVEGGVVGGVPGGVLGGVLGGTGTGPVMDYDQPPRLLKSSKPVYPQEAFIKKIEGTVLLEILIDTNGRVARARVLQSIPQLDAAALQTVYQWIFSPAIKHGRPVPTIAQAPVGFKIY